MIISVGEARKILGEEASNMTDEQIKDSVLTLDAIARETIRAYERGEFKVPSDER